MPCKKEAHSKLPPSHCAFAPSHCVFDLLEKMCPQLVNLCSNRLPILIFLIFLFSSCFPVIFHLPFRGIQKIRVLLEGLG